MLVTAIAVECAERDAHNAKYAPTIPATCQVLPVAIESRRKTLRLLVAARFIAFTF
jgi:hypothetical protein